MLEWAYENARVDSSVYAGAARGGRLHVLQWALSKAIPWVSTPSHIIASSLIFPPLSTPHILHTFYRLKKHALKQQEEGICTYCNGL